MGNCFEHSTLLVSLLIGAGYDAYVVHGYATRDICYGEVSTNQIPFYIWFVIDSFDWNHYRDQTFEDPPEDEPIVPAPAADPLPVSKYQIKQPKKLESEYEKMMLQKEAAYKERLRREKLEQEQRERDEAERPTG